MTNKELFQKFSEENRAKLPFSLRFSWWNEVVKTNWEVAVVKKSEQVFAIMPYFLRRKGPWTMVTNPHFTPYCGPFINYPEDQKNSSRIAFEHEMHTQLIEQLPDFSEYTQNFHLDFNNSLAFTWAGFQNSCRFTYLSNLKQTEQELWSSLRENNRRQIKKAQKKLTVNTSEDADLLQQLLQESFENAIEPDYFNRMLQYIHQHQCGQLLTAGDAEEVHAALFCIWDYDTAYYLVGGSKKVHKNSGAMSLLIWHAMLEGKQQGKSLFNFEGSSIAAIEKYLRGFGGKLHTFQRLEFNRSKSLQLAKRIKS